MGISFSLSSFWELLVSRWPELVTELFRHINMTTLALLISLAIGVPLGILITRNQTAAKIVIGIANVMQSIPSIALLSLAVCFLGIGTVPAILMVFVYAFLPILKNTYTGIMSVDPKNLEVALLSLAVCFLGIGTVPAILMVFVYAFLPILKNTYTGIMSVDPKNLEVARGMGLTRTRCLFTVPAILMVFVYAFLPILKNTYTGIMSVDPKNLEVARGMGLTRTRCLFLVELPIAAPFIMAGIRIAAVASVGTMTIAAFAGAKGLGWFINLGLNSLNVEMILLGAVPVSLLALLFDFIFAKLEQAVTSEGLLPNEQIQNLPKKVIRRRQVIAVGVCVALVVVAIGGNLVNKKSDKHLTVGASNFTEVYIVGNIYKELIEAKTDIQVDTTFGLASTSLEMTAMENGDIDMVVDYSGQVYLSVLGLPLNTNTDEVYEILSEKMRDDYNISVSAPLGYNNTYAMSVRPEIAEQYQLETLTDLMAVAPELRLGCTADFTQREDALPRLESTFHTKFGEVNALDVAVRYTAIDSGQVDVIDAFATDALLSKFDLVQLEDDASFFPPYYAVNFIRQECLDEYPELKEVLALLDGRISNEAMAAMNAEVDLEGRNAADVAHDFLVEEGLI